MTHNMILAGEISRKNRKKKQKRFADMIVAKRFYFLFLFLREISPAKIILCVIGCDYFALFLIKTSNDNVKNR